MSHRYWLSACVLLSAGLTTAVAQVPAQPPTQVAPQASNTGASKSAPSASYQPYKRRSIVHHYPYPYPEMYHGDETAGFRNPGGTGRFLEYYPAGNTFQQNNDPVTRAKFDQGGGAPDRAEQMAAQQIGIARYNSIQGHIDNMARPAFGYGFFGGFN